MDGLGVSGVNERLKMERVVNIDVPTTAALSQNILLNLFFLFRERKNKHPATQAKINK